MSSNDESIDLVILFGSETGNCEDLAKSIGRQAIERSLRVRVIECDEYNVSELIYQKLILFICSTTGVGEEPNNMKTFWKFIRRRDLPKDSLSSVYISVIGLGDSSYEKYNFVAKKLFRRLLDLGGKPLIPLVLGDDKHDCGYNATVLPSIEHFWSEVNRVFNVGTNISLNSDKLFDSSYSVRFVSDFEEKPFNELNGIKSNETEFHKNNPYLAELISNERVTSKEHFQDVRHLKLKIEETKLSYNLGDICYVRPQNSQTNVDKFLSLLNLDKNQLFILEKRENNFMSHSSYFNHLPKPCSVERLVSDYLDIQSVPKRSFFDLLYRFSESDLEKQKLKDFAQKSDSEELYEYCNRPKRTIVEVLSDFVNTTPYIRFEYLFDLIPAINARPFSIASSSLVNGNELHLLVGVVEYKTRLKEVRIGLCSNWLANQLPSKQPKIPIYIKRGSFKIGADSVPFIMIGPGTGLAPFKAFIEERVHKQISSNYLFFGCRYRSYDFYFEEEWKRLEKLGQLEYFVAFSRDLPQKVYVQHILWQQKDKVFKLLSESKAYIYVSGNAKQMPQQIRETISDIFKEKMKELSHEKIDAIINDLEIKGRIQFECWA